MVLVTGYVSPLETNWQATLVYERVHGWGQLVGNPNPEFMALLLNIQRRLDDQAAIMQQQAEMIQSLQQ